MAKLNSRDIRAFYTPGLDKLCKENGLELQYYFDEDVFEVSWRFTPSFLTKHLDYVTDRIKRSKE